MAAEKNRFNKNIDSEKLKKSAMLALKMFTTAAGIAVDFDVFLSFCALHILSATFN